MKSMSLITSFLTILLLLSTLICGLWIKSHGLTTDASILAFHSLIGIASVISGILASVLLIIQTVKH